MIQLKSIALLVSVIPMVGFADVLSCRHVGQTGSQTIVLNSAPEKSDSAVLISQADRAPAGEYSALYADNGVKQVGKKISMHFLDRAPIDWTNKPCYEFKYGQLIHLEAKSATRYEGTDQTVAHPMVDRARSSTCSVPRIAVPPALRIECDVAELSVTLK